MESSVQSIPESLIYGMVEGTPIYYQEKTDELLNFGVQKVVWIFTDTRNNDGRSGQKSLEPH